MIPVYETDRFIKEANRCALGDFAEDLRERLTRDPDPNVHFDCSLPMRTWYTAKKRKGRIVGRMRTVRVCGDEGVDQDVFCLLRVIGFDDPDGKYILGKQAREKVKTLHEGIDERELRAFVEKWLVDRDRASSTATHALPAVPSSYTEWLRPPEWVTAGDLDPLGLVVYETKEWRQRMPTIKDHWAEIHNLLVPFFYDSLDDPLHKASIKQVEDGIYVVQTPRQVIVLCIYKPARDACQRRLLMLVDARDENNRNDTPRDQWIKRKVEGVAASETAPLDEELCIDEPLARRAIRAYPGFYLDKEAYHAWMKIEEDESANLAMSPEEEALLARLTRAVGPEDAMPAFINGRAGSGKSTILYYLFAHYWMHGRRPGATLPGHPLFLTLSGRLLNMARDTVLSIVEADCRYLAASHGSTKVTAGLAEAFSPFRSMLLKILPPSSLSRYSQDREVDFEVFRRLVLCQDDPRYPRRARFMGKLDSWCSPELCWHVIRSYVKGFSPRGLMDVGSYRRLPKMDRSVEEGHFEWVYERVWPWYRELTEDGAGYWDQQDLAREVLTGLIERTLDLPRELQHCVAIFCDEAQDLTGVELSLVLRLSFLARHDLRSVKPLANIPFAFAGDPLQTLNPSGFRWDNLTSSFYRNLLQPLGLHRSLAKSELHFNYRSPRLITRLANLVQFHRRVVFQDNYLKPQRPWSLDDGMPPTRFRIQNELTESEMKGLQDSVILLPCAEGHEEEFMERYSVLQQLKNGINPPAMISVMSAKGLDLKKVVVFAFGATLFPDGIPGGEEDDLEKGHHIGLSYAFNQLYVAITRSTDELLLMDTEDGHSLLWDQLLDPVRIQSHLDAMDFDSAAAWREVLPEGALPLWDSEVQFAPLNNEDLAKQAYSLKDSGMALRRVDFMEKAAAFYRKAGRSNDEQECKAYALWYSGNHSEAARQFQELRRANVAAECLWEGMVWRDLAEMGASIAPARATLVRFMVSSAKPADRVRSLLDDADRDLVHPEAPTVPQWREAVAKLTPLASQLLLRLPDGANVPPRLDIRLAQFLRALGKLGHPGCMELATDGFAKAGEWSTARQLLDEIGPMGKVDSRDLIMGRTARWPEYIRPCCRAKMYDYLVQRWIDEGSRIGDLGRDDAEALFAVLRVRKPAVAFTLAKEAGLTNALLTNRKGMRLTPDQQLHLADLLAREGLWCSLAEIMAERLDHGPRPIDLDRLCQALWRNRPMRGSLPREDFEALGTIGSLLTESAKKLRPSWPTDSTSFRRMMAALEIVGLDKLMSDLGLSFGDAEDVDVQRSARLLFLRGRRLYRDRASPGDWNDMKGQTERQLAKWGMLLDVMDTMAPDAFDAVGLPSVPEVSPERRSPFDHCVTQIQDLASCWLTEFRPYEIRIAKGPDGIPSGTVEVTRRDGGRPQVLFVDSNQGNVCMSNGTVIEFSSSPEVEDLGGSVRVEQSASGFRVSLRFPPWPEAVVISFTSDSTPS